MKLRSIQSRSAMQPAGGTRVFQHNICKGLHDAETLNTNTDMQVTLKKGFRFLQRLGAVQTPSLKLGRLCKARLHGRGTQSSWLLTAWHQSTKNNPALCPCCCGTASLPPEIRASPPWTGRSQIHIIHFLKIPCTASP